MKDEYDFSKGERGKFYHPAAEFNTPIYLEPELSDFIEEIAFKKGVDMNDIVNDWLKRDVALIKSVSEKGV